MTLPGQLAARLTLARAITNDFKANSGLLNPSLSSTEWAHRINTALTALIAAIEEAQHITTTVRPDLSAAINPRDLMTVLGALSDGSSYRAMRGDYITAAQYRALSRALGDDR